MHGITWLHLSDWHQETNGFDQDLVRDRLMEDIRSRASEISPNLEQIDFIIFSGDIAANGREQEYKAAISHLFTPLLQETGLNESGKDRLFIVPGNHDLNRSRREAEGIVPSDLVKELGTTKAVNEWLSDDRCLQTLLSPFQAYEHFITNYIGNCQENCQASGAKPALSYVRSFPVRGKLVTIVGINSALLSGCNINAKGEIDDEGHLFLGESHLYKVLQMVRNADLCIGVMHHPLDWLANFDRRGVRALLREKCHFVLRGHEHSTEIEVSILRGTADECAVISAGASYAQRVTPELRYANAYNYVHVNFPSSRFTVYLRRYDDRRGWIKDNGATGDERPGEFESRLPKTEEKIPQSKRNFLEANGYRVRKQIAKGGMSAVWLATRDDERFAIKELRAFPSANKELIEKWKDQFENEYKILSKLNHSGIPRFIDYYSRDDTYCIVMDYVDGLTLEEKLKKMDANEQQVLEWTSQICDILDHLHSGSPPVIHRDINPSNVMLCHTDDRIVLIDFGIAKSFRDDQYRYHTQTVLKLGTEGYMPPEQSSNTVYDDGEEGGTDPRSDVYSLGATVYYLLTKTIPLDSICRAIDFRRYGEDGLKLPRELNSHISRNTEEVILNAIQLCKEDRYQTVREFRDALFSSYQNPPQTIINPKDQSEMVLIPKGDFWMGANDAGEDEKPRRKVSLDDFFIDKYPVTYRQYKRFVEATKYKRKPPEGDSAYYTEEWDKYYEEGREDYPVVNITWDDAKSYAEWAGKELPTEEQWEKAARGKNGIIYPWGDKWDSRKCNSFLLNDPTLIARMNAMWEDGRGTLPIGCFPKGISPYGVMDMAGNVLEWTNSAYTIRGSRVVRGGSWYRDAPSYFRCSKRYWYFTKYSVNWLGMRCVAKLS